MRRRLALVIALAALPLACGRLRARADADEVDPDPDAGPQDAGAEFPPAPDDYASFSHVFSQLYCRRVFSCCLPAERPTGMDDEPTCELKEEDVALAIGMDLITRERSRYDHDAATTCLRNLTNARCGALFSRDVGRFVACQDILKGLLPNGASCDADIECAGGRCGGSGCEITPAPRCANGEYFDGVMCEARHETGAACSSPTECLTSLTCLGDHCGAPLADGEPCSTPRDCIGTCTIVAGQSPAFCRPAVCSGS